MIRIENLTKTFDDRVIFSKTNLDFEKGKIYALIGKSGCGKSTLLNMIGYLEDFDEGTIFYDDVPLKKIKSQHFFRDILGYLFQDFGLIESGTIKENLSLGLIGKKLKENEKNSLYQKALETVQLSYLDLNQRIYSLSGGEAQRVALAKIILKDPPLILADEPTAALDTTNSAEIMSILKNLRQENRIIIIATHNPLVWEQADHLINIEDIANHSEKQ